VNISTLRRNSRISAIVAAALCLSVSSALVAQPNPEEPAAQGAAGEMKTLAVIAGARYEKLIDDIGFLGSLAGQPQAGQLAEAMIDQYTMGKAATAIDKKKPWGVIVQTDGSNFYPVACLPVAKPDDALEIAKAYGAEIKDAENDTKELSLQNLPPFYMKSQNDTVFISHTAAALSRLPENPQGILTKMVADYDLSAAISVKNVPEMYRQFAIGALQAGTQQGMRKQSKETDEEFADRQRMLESQIQQITRQINEIDSIKLGLAVDSQQKRTYLDFTYQFVPGSKTAQQAAGYADAHTNFAGFYQQDAAATFTFSSKIDPKLIGDEAAQLESMMRSMKQQLDREIDKSDKLGDAASRDALKGAAADFIDAVVSTVKGGQMDGGASLQLSPDSFMLVAGMLVKEPAKIEAALKKLETAKNSPEFPIKAFQWNAANHAGVNFHSFTFDTSQCEHLNKLVGDTLHVAVGIGANAVYLGMGRNEMDTLNKAIDASAANPNKAVPPFELALSLRPIIETIAAHQDNPREKEKAQAVADMLKEQALGKDHVRAVGKVIPNGLVYRFEAEEGVMKTIGAIIAQEHQRRAAAN
jgi:hypothetical protein